MDSAVPPLAVHCLYGDGHCQLRRPGVGATSRMGGLLAAAPALPAAIDRPVYVRAPVCRQVAQRVKIGKKAATATMTKATTTMKKTKSAATKAKAGDSPS